MELILWRHTQALELQPGQSDSARQLTAKGQKQAKLMAQWLRAHIPHDSRILASPATRTTQTADALKLPYSIVDALAPDSTAEELLRVAQWPSAPLTTILVGHQPYLGNLASLLISGTKQDWNIKKGAVWWISVLSRNTANLNAVINPALL
jgi:phosphohistidine phosphatase